MSRRTRKLQDGASIAEHARRLRQRAGWDPAALAGRQEERLEQSRDDLRRQETYDDAARCEACAQLRDTRQDPEALCEAHLAQALGFPVP